MSRSTKRSDGYRTKSFQWKGKRYYVYGRSEREVNEKLEKKRQELEKSTFLSSKDMTVRQYCERWVENKRGTVASSTIRSHYVRTERICKCKIDRNHTFGDLMLTEVEPDHIRELQRQLDKSGLRTTTTNATIVEIRSVFKSALIDRIVDFNPALGIKPLKRHEEKITVTTHRALTRDEIARFFEVAKGSWYYNIFRFMIQTGCRCGEAAALMFDDVENGVASIKRTITRLENGDYVVGDTAKTKAGIRKIPLTDEAIAALEEQKQFTLMHTDKDALKKEPLYFRNTRGGIVGVHFVDEAIRVVCRDSGVEPFSSHAFRHTFATLAVEGGMSPKVLQSIMGHSDISLTMNLYSHAMEDTKAREMNDCFNLPL